MVKGKVVVRNKTGIVAHPATTLVEFARKYKSRVMLVQKDKRANAASIIGVLALGAGAGTELEVTAEGADEEKALKGILRFIEELDD